MDLIGRGLCFGGVNLLDVLAEIRYQKMRPIGIGQGMNSEVFLVFDPQLGGEIAVKEVPKARFGTSPASYFEEAGAMFASAHPPVVPVLYACQTAAQISVAMPYYANGSLHSRIEAGPLRLRECLRVGHGVLHGLTQIHLQSFLHLDVKPSNVLFDDTDKPMVADFGQARSLNCGVVTAPRMYQHAFPPETLQTTLATVQSDVYQTGLLLYRCVNGNPYYEAQVPVPHELRAKIVAGKFPNRELFMPHVPKRLRTVIRKALRMAPTDRYHSATEMSDALAKVEVALDWAVTVGANGAVTWRAARRDRPDLVVELSPASGAAWDVGASTAGCTGLRAKARGRYWRDRLTRKDAEVHLKQVFAELEG
ncbi:MAG: serine/threonine-protein kinase [Candidatus Sulfotelmatobacter sp.]